MCMIRSRLLLMAAAFGVLGAMLPLRAAEPKELDALLKKQVELKKGDRIVFLGDSLTFLGGKEEPKQHVTKGFVRIVKETLNEKHPDKNIDCDWVSTGGGTVQTLLSLLDKALAKKPTIVVIQIGCNDARGSTPEKFKAGLEELNDKLKKADIRVVQCTCTSVGEKHDGTNQHDKKLEEFAEIAREVALAKQVPLLDLRKAFVEHWKKNNPDNKASGILTYDGNHWNDAGNKFVAEQMLTKFK
ncbi:hypothetical protein AYO44_13445 [Planctomycetaceae bacterium SCGC AG-212-F19]|nr:hypothetical protein AYO44_13445 [Planctomycetaceae bacterium SCGC AG-212-F19]